jgi:signal transduction histidine kinase/CheY-like chemotaxis protein
MSDERARQLFNGLSDAATRAQAAQALASHLGAESLALYVVDPALGVMLPAAGMPKTVTGGPRWRAFLERCLREDGFSAIVDWPAGSERPAVALASGGAAFILAGGNAAGVPLDGLRAQLPMLAALLVSEQKLSIERAEAAQARDAAARSGTLAKALDTSRASIAALNLQLRREHERKDEFLAMLAHELRNPLSPLVNSIELLRHGSVRDKAGMHQLDVMSRQLIQLTRLVEDLLDVSRVSRGQIQLRRELLSLDGILADSVEAVRPAIEAREQQLQAAERGPELYVNGDRVRLTQVFANLLHNASKYTGRGGRISISTVADTGRASVVIRDNGAGIPPDMLSTIFELFAQVPGSLDRAQGGLGIGLTLARTLIGLHGGQVSAHSVGTGHGSTFTVTLPLVEGQRPASHRSPEPAVAAPESRSLRVLVVDDNEDAAESLAEVVRLMGAGAMVAHDGPRALEAARSYSPELIFLDIGLPGWDGYETAQRLRALPGPRAKIYALTGYGTAQDKQRTVQAGFDAHLVKPVDPASIQQILSALVPMHAVS